MSGSDLHPWRQPDQARVERWRAEIEHLRGIVTELVEYRDAFEDFATMVCGDERILNGASPFPAHVKAWYIDSQVMRIRRLVDQGGEGGNVHSLRLLLEEMRRISEAFTRANIEELFDATEAPRYDAEARDFLVSSMWSNAGDIVNEADRLYARHIREDLKALTESTDPIKRYADKYIAHDTIDGIPKDERMLYADISRCVDVIAAIAIRYIATLTGAGYVSLSPVTQHDVHDIFRFAWKGSA